MARSYPRFVFSNQQNTKNKGPFVIHSLFPRLVCKLHHRNGPIEYPLNANEVFLPFRNNRFGIEPLEVWDVATNDQVWTALLQLDKWLTGIISLSPNSLPVVNSILLESGKKQTIHTFNYNVIMFEIINIHSELPIDLCKIIYNKNHLLFSKGQSRNDRALLLNGLMSERISFPINKVQCNSIYLEQVPGRKENGVNKVMLFYELS